MSEPSRSDGPFLRNAYRHADAIDDATTSGERRRAWARFVPAMLIALIEDYLRDTARFGVVILSVVVAIVGLEPNGAWAGVAGVVGAVLGTIAVFVPLARRSTPARQWATIAVVVVAQVALLVAFLQWA